MGSVRKRGNRWLIDYRDPKGKRIRVSFGKKKDAEAELGKRVSLIAEKRYLDVKREFTTTLKQLARKYTQNYTHPVKEYYCQNFMEFYGKLTLLARIRYYELETYRNHLRGKLTKAGKVRKDSSVNREMSCIRHMFTKAVEWDMIERNPFETGQSLMLKENNQRLRFLNDDEIPSLVDACPPYLRYIVQCALHTGMRKGEILSLKWEQVQNGFIYLRKTKNKEPRQIPINDELAAILKKIRKENHLKSEYVFLYNGRPVGNIKKGFKSALTKAGIEDFRFHDLRHTFASQILMRGSSLKDVQELLGHKDIKMTMRYAHLTQEHKRNAVNLLNGLTESCSNTPTINPIRQIPQSSNGDACL